MNNQQPQKVPVSEIISMLVAIGDRNWQELEALERSFVNKYNAQKWEYVFNFQLLPSLNRIERRWVFQQRNDGETNLENIIELAQYWIRETQGLRLVQATDGQGKPVTIEEILSLSQSCEWALIDNISDTPYAKSGYLHPFSLEIGSGNRDEAYTCSGDAKVIFFNAYYD